MFPASPRRMQVQDAALQAAAGGLRSTSFLATRLPSSLPQKQRARQFCKSTPAKRRSLNIDDEGQPTQETVLIENGILKGYLSDKLSSKLMGLADTGNGRRESYEHIPMPRMTNTYMLAGQDDPADIIRSVKNGVYAVNFGGGQVDI